jgi:hypothetical protein
MLKPSSCLSHSPIWFQLVKIRLTFYFARWGPFTIPTSGRSSPTLRVGALAVDSPPPLAPLARKTVTTIAFFGGII